MRLVVGLGNPGERYAATRHNVAWQVLDELAARWRANDDPPSPLKRTRRALVGGETVVLMQPLTYMNEVGRALESWKAEPALPRANWLIVTDDVYLPVGTLRIRQHGSSGGHRGLASVEQALDSREFARLRIGVGAAESNAQLKQHVLEAFDLDERPAVEAAVRRAADAVECWVTQDIRTTMNRFNRRVRKEVPES